MNRQLLAGGLRWTLPVCAVLAFALALGTCGGGEPDPPEGLALSLPDALPSTDEVAAAFSSPEYEAQVKQEHGAFASNEEVGKNDHERGILEFESNIGEVRASGRVYGYVASYSLPGPARMIVELELYEDDVHAYAALHRPPQHRAGLPVLSPDVGDATIAWPTITSNSIPMCPCELRFRVGRLVGAVKTILSAPPPPAVPSRPPPKPLDEPDPRNVEVARLVASGLQEIAAGPTATAD